MEKDMEFEKWFKAEQSRLAAQGFVGEAVGARLTRHVAHEAWKEGERQGAAWFRSVCAEEMGADAPGGEASHPLRDWLQELKALRASHHHCDLPATLEEVLGALRLHGGSFAALADAGELVRKKNEDYNSGVDRDDYFPLGLPSYAQMIFVKALRLVALAGTPRALNFESARDSMLDLINYASFGADWLERQEQRRPTTPHPHAEDVLTLVQTLEAMPGKRDHATSALLERLRSNPSGRAR
jgi:hypothetical protein